MELFKESVAVNEDICKNSTQIMVDGDVIVPDTKPDILKLLQVDAVSCITDKDISSGKIDISGRVDLKILYIPDSESECIKSIITAFDFSYRIDNRNIEPDSFAVIASNVDRVEFTLTNSRKLKIKAVTAIEYEVVNRKEIEIAVDADSGAEMRKETVSLQNMLEGTSQEINISDSMEIPNGQSSIKELLKYDISICDTEYKMVSGKVVLKGMANVCILYTNSDNRIEFSEAEIPFTEVADIENGSEDCMCDIEYSIISSDCVVSEDSDGDMRIAEINICVLAQIRACETIETEMICDCYVPYSSTNLDCEEVTVNEITARPSVQHTIRESVSFPQNAPGVSGVYNVITRPYISKSQLQRGKLLCEGRIEAYILYLSESSENPVYSMKTEIPFSYMIDCEEQDDDAVCEVKCEIKHTGYSLVATGEVELRCILSISANVIKKRKINLINGVDITDTENSGGMIIYFVQRGDSLWEIAKHYAVPCEKIVNVNNLEENKRLEEGCRLLIPR